MTSAWYGIVILLWVLGNPRYWSTRGEGRRERATRYGLDGLGGGHNQPAPAPHGEHNRSRRGWRKPRSTSPGQGAEAHHRAIRLTPGHDTEAVPGEGRRDPREQVGGVARHGRVDRIGLQGRSASGGRGRDGGLDQRVHDALA